VLFFGGNLLFKTSDGGLNWEQISPDLSREAWDVPASVGKFTTEEMKKMPRRGVIYTIAPSALDLDVIWCGTDDGLIWLTRDGGKKWDNVTPPAIESWSKISLMDAGHFDKGTAYAAVNRIRCDDQRPHIYRTHDWGKTWTEIVGGLPEAPVNVVREDPLRQGLLFCGTERTVHFSADDGATWKSLRQNMPATSVRDLVVHGSDLAIATHGRGFWILDNFSLLRELDSSQVKDVLFPIQPAYLLERNTNSDTPLPQDEPVAPNPPDGAMIDYSLTAAWNKVTIEILDPSKQVIRTFTSDDPLTPVDPLAITVMPGWARPPRRPGVELGGHRFVWDLRPTPASGGGGRGGGLPISAIWGETPVGPQRPMVAPGSYTVRLTLERTGASATRQVMERTLQVLPDPRQAPE
jgi:hypothetical protein